MQGLELLVAVLLARNRQPPPTVAAGVPHAELAAELVSLPSGLLAMVCEAIVKLKVRLGGCVCVCACVRAPASVHAYYLRKHGRSVRLATVVSRPCGVLTLLLLTLLLPLQLLLLLPLPLLLLLLLLLQLPLQLLL